MTKKELRALADDLKVQNYQLRQTINIYLDMLLERETQVEAVLDVLAPAFEARKSHRRAQQAMQPHLPEDTL